MSILHDTTRLGVRTAFFELFLAMGWFRFESESTPAHRPPLTRAVSTLHTQPRQILGVMRNSSKTVWRFNRKQ